MGYGFEPMLVPDDLRYSEDHQWVRSEGALWRVGITEFAQEALGEVTMVRVHDGVELIAAGDELGEIEAFKAMTDLYMPANAVVVELNPALVETPTAVNRDPYGEGWLCLVRPESADDLSELMSAEDYRKLIGGSHG